MNIDFQFTNASDFECDNIYTAWLLNRLEADLETIGDSTIRDHFNSLPLITINPSEVEVESDDESDSESELSVVDESDDESEVEVVSDDEDMMSEVESELDQSVVDSCDDESVYDCEVDESFTVDDSDFKPIALPVTIPVVNPVTDVICESLDESTEEFFSEWNQVEDQVRQTMDHILDVVELLHEQSLCKVCRSTLSCHCCQPPVTNTEVAEIPVEISTVNSVTDTVCDIKLLNSSVVVTGMTSISAINLDQVMINDYSLVKRSENNFKPLKSEVEFTKVPVCDYGLTTKSAYEYYGHCSGQTRMIKKIIADNNLQFSAPTEYFIAALDIETYNEVDHHLVPVIDNIQSHIGMCCVHLQKISSGVVVSEQKHCWILDHQYDLTGVESDVIIHICRTEQQIAAQVLLTLSLLKRTTFVLTFNGSSSLFDDKCGYDIPFLIHRSRLNLTWSKKIHSMSEYNGEQVARSASIMSIDQLPFCQFVDLSRKLYCQASQDEKNQLEARGLDNWLQLYEIPTKLSHNYQDLQSRLSATKSAIGDIINYCMYDCSALIKLDNHKAITLQAISMCNLLSLPLSMVCHYTMAKLLEVYLTRMYTTAGCAISYYESGLSSGYKGAYCETVAVAGQVYSNCMCADFASLYPNSMRSFNACLLTVLDQPTTDCITVDTSDDDKFGQPAVYFSRDRSLMCEFITKMFNTRAQCKVDMKSVDKKSTTYAQLDSQQLSIKLVINILYGLMGNSRSPLFDQRLAVATTAFGRKATMTARDIFISRGHTFLASDTDSVFVVTSPTITDSLDYELELVVVNDIIHEKVSSLLNLEIEEVIERLCFMDGRKSYISLNAEGKDMKSWLRDVQPWTRDRIPSDNCKLKIRGCSWSKQNQVLRDQTKQMIRTFMIDSISKVEGNWQQVISAMKFWSDQKTVIKTQIESAISTCDLNQLAIYCERVKMSSEKSSLVKHLKQCYDQLLTGDDYCSVIQLRGNQSAKTLLKVPLSCITPANVSRVDVDQLIAFAMSSLTKLLLSADEKKSVGVKSYFNQQLEALIDSKTDDSIIVRVEKLSAGGVTRYTTELWDKATIAARLFKLADNISVHELITDDTIRFFLDVDGKSTQDIMLLVSQCTEQLGKLLGFTPVNRVLISTGEKQSAHIYYDVNMSLSYARYIADRLHKLIPEVDTAVYRMKGSLRLPNCNKITSGQVVNRRFICDYDTVVKCLISSSDDYPTVYQPLHTITTAIIDAFYTCIDKTVSDGDVELVSQWLSSQKISADCHVSGSVIKITTRSPWLCPIHNRVHENDNMWVTSGKDAVVVYCCRTTDKLLRQTEKVVITRPDSKKDERKISEITLHKLINQCQSAVNQLSTAMVQNNRYLNVNLRQQLSSYDTVFIRSQLGSGKSQKLADYLSDYTGKVLIVSHRKTFTSDICSRYGGISYNDISGALSLNQHRVIVCQAESLSRVRGYQSALVVVDELESILSQLNNGVARSSSAHKHFANIIQSASKVIVMDGFLQQTTVDMINNIRQKSSTVIQNTNMPYTGSQIDVYNYTPSCNQTVVDQITTALVDGKKIACMITSKTLIHHVMDAVKSLNKSVKCYTGDDFEITDGVTHAAIKQNDLSDVTNNWQCDLLIYSATITAGVNFDINWFDSFIHVFAAETCDALSFIQGCFRVRQFADKHHTIWLQHQNTVYQPCSPHDLMIDGDDAIYNASITEQLLLWLSARKIALDINRSQIVIRSLVELGFQLNYQAVGQKSTMIKSTHDVYMMSTVTADDVEFYKRARDDKQFLISATRGLTASQVKKIVACLSLEIDPTHQFGESTARVIESQLSNLKSLHWLKKISSTMDVNELLSVVDLDKQARLVAQSSVKAVDRTRLKKSVIEPIRVLSLVSHLLSQPEFKSTDLPAEITSGNRPLSLLNAAAVLLGKVVTVTSTIKLKNTRVHTYVVNNLIDTTAI